MVAETSRVVGELVRLANGFSASHQFYLDAPLLRHFVHHLFEAGEILVLELLQDVLESEADPQPLRLQLREPVRELRYFKNTILLRHVILLVG